MTDDDMGKGMVSNGGGSLTDKDWKHMADKWTMTVDQAKKHTYDILKKQVGN